MRVALVCKDKPASLHIRQENRPAHLEHIRSTGVVEMAGPFLSEAGEMCGSLVILEVETLAQAQDWAANDPYAKAGLFESVQITEWKKVVG
ncbi:YciI family protein [Gemmobacter caeruleus]|uniref:YciI family protein n=1 Tax=Gemmobacter caeruleus TaxID=2595004 RepID=UPI0011EDC3A1|nr:YciI family protein [Gemmobacter caeruleus]